MRLVYGAMVGDINGSPCGYERAVDHDFPLFRDTMFISDDSILTVATMKALLEAGPYVPGEKCLKKLESTSFRAYREMRSEYPDADYGERFRLWMKAPRIGAPSSGNGAAMRLFPVAYWAPSLKTARELARVNAAITHNEEDGIKGGVCLAEVLFRVLHGENRKELHRAAVSYYPELETRDYLDYAHEKRWSALGSASLPQDLSAFLASSYYEDAVRKAILIGSDADTLGAIAGSLAEGFYGPSSFPVASVMVPTYLPPGLLANSDEFNSRIPGERP